MDTQDTNEPEYNRNLLKTKLAFIKEPSASSFNDFAMALNVANVYVMTVEVTDEETGEPYTQPLSVQGEDGKSFFFCFSTIEAAEEMAQSYPDGAQVTAYKFRDFLDYVYDVGKGFIFDLEHDPLYLFAESEQVKQLHDNLPPRVEQEVRPLADLTAIKARYMLSGSDDDKLEMLRALRDSRLYVHGIFILSDADAQRVKDTMPKGFISMSDPTRFRMDTVDVPNEGVCIAVYTSEKYMPEYTGEGNTPPVPDDLQDSEMFVHGTRQVDFDFFIEHFRGPCRMPGLILDHGSPTGELFIPRCLIINMADVPNGRIKYQD